MTTETGNVCIAALVGNAEQQQLQYQDDQNQINALTFKERTKKFYADYESGQVDRARQIIPIEAIGVYKRKRIKAAYRFLKLIEVKTGRFKRRAMFAAAAAVIFILEPFICFRVTRVLMVAHVCRMSCSGKALMMSAFSAFKKRVFVAVPSEKNRYLFFMLTFNWMI